MTPSSTGSSKVYFPPIISLSWRPVDFMIQAGDPTGTGRKSSFHPFSFPLYLLSSQVEENQSMGRFSSRDSLSSPPPLVSQREI
jgi:hypothetical protein